jgi:hypothetical protein
MEYVVSIWEISFRPTLGKHRLTLHLLGRALEARLESQGAAGLTLDTADAFCAGAAAATAALICLRLDPSPVPTKQNAHFSARS